MMGWLFSFECSSFDDSPDGKRITIKYFTRKLEIGKLEQTNRANVIFFANLDGLVRERPPRGRVN